MFENVTFLGGTCGDSKWREEGLIPLLNDGVEVFNPVVPDWNEEAYQKELKAREECKYCLYVLTPATPSSYSIAEVVDDSNKRPEKTIFVFLTEDCGKSLEAYQVKAMGKIAKMVEANGAKSFTSLEEVADFLNH